jgi:hypothetical protein
MIERKPPVRMESRDVPRCIRFKASEWDTIVQEAHAEGIEPSRLARSLMFIGLDHLRAERLRQSRSRIAL